MEEGGRVRKRGRERERGGERERGEIRATIKSHMGKGPPYLKVHIY